MGQGTKESASQKAANTRIQQQTPRRPHRTEQATTNARGSKGSNENWHAKQQKTHQSRTPPVAPRPIPATPHVNTPSAGFHHFEHQGYDSAAPQSCSFQQSHHSTQQQGSVSNQQYFGSAPTSGEHCRPSSTTKQWPQNHSSQEQATHFQQSNCYHQQKTNNSHPYHGAKGGAQHFSQFASCQGGPFPGKSVPDPNPFQPSHQPNSSSSQNHPCPPSSPSSVGNVQGQDCTGALTKKNILVSWALQPPSYEMLRPIDALLTTVHETFPPAFGVKSHTYFSKWAAIKAENLRIHGTNIVDESQLKKHVRKLRFFLHPDRLPRDLSDEQAMVCKLLWDVTSDAWESYGKQAICLPPAYGTAKQGTQWQSK